MFNTRNKEQIIVPQGIDIINYQPNFLNKIDKLCDSFSKIYSAKNKTESNLIDESDSTHYNYMDVIFEKCITFLIEIEQVKMMEFYKSTEPNWSEYCNNLKKIIKNKGE
jgi:hypothetical protein